ncbi:hypothetical protein BB559_004817 [Furculomyces boomerangus]|uniref:Uncharacterized protein n=1 Tax=Furculomyces boomerangus TaxID=61424 RepID=A0A2T9YCH7_9FUNG|nr:hypothetical protein BB559_004817 [Furculomyces boomerangus]
MTITKSKTLTDLEKEKGDSVPLATKKAETTTLSTELKYVSTVKYLSKHPLTLETEPEDDIYSSRIRWEIESYYLRNKKKVPKWVKHPPPDPGFEEREKQKVNKNEEKSKGKKPTHQNNSGNKLHVMKKEPKEEYKKSGSVLSELKKVKRRSFNILQKANPPEMQKVDNEPIVILYNDAKPQENKKKRRNSKIRTSITGMFSIFSKSKKGKH